MTPRPGATTDDLRRIATWGDPGTVPDPATLVPRRPGAATGASPRRLWRVAAGVLAVAAVAAAVVLATDPADPIPATRGTWRPMAAGPLEPRAEPAAVWSGQEMLVFGGDDAGGLPFLDGAAYDPATDTWRPMAPYPGPSAGLWAGGVATWNGTEMLVFMRGSGSTRWDWDLAAYDPAADSWRTLLEGRFTQNDDDSLTALAPVPVQQPDAAAWIVGELVIVGWDSNQGSYLWSSLDLATTTWSEPRELPDSIDFYMQPKHWASTERHLLLLREGPIHDGRRWTAYLIDPQAGSSRRVEAPQPLPGSLAMEGGLTAAGSQFVQTGVWTNDQSDSTWAAHVLDPDSADRRPAWEAAAAPTPWPPDGNRPGAALVGTGDGPLLLGGLPPGDHADDVLARGADRAVARWGDLPRPPIDLRRVRHVAVSTGQEVLIWGGATEMEAPAAGDLFGDGAVYDLAEDAP